jgi:hypothetical protein
MKDLLIQLREDANFQAIMAECIKSRPVVPEYLPQDTADKTLNLMEEIKYGMASRAGFDLLYRVLTGSNPSK